MHEKVYVKKCLDEIEQKLQWPSRDKWVYEDFKQIQDLIFDASSIQLSVHTLERLFGKLKTQENYNPQIETKNALAIFLGYKSWAHYKSENKFGVAETKALSQHENPLSVDDSVSRNESIRTNNFPTVRTPERESGNSRLRSRLVIGMGGGGCLAILYLLLNQSLNTVPAIGFTVANPYGRVPHTAKFTCDSRNSTLQGLQVDFGTGSPWSINENQSTFFKTYMSPGIHMVQVKHDSSTVARTRVFIDTQGWQGYIYKTYENNNTRQPLPSSSLRLPGKLYTSPALVKDTLRKSIYFVEDNLVREFGVDGDNLTFDTRFKSTVQNGGVLCNDMWFKLTGTQGVLKMHFLAPGCSGYVQMIFGDQNLDGRIHDLSPFTRDFSDWKTARMTVANKQVSIYFDNKLIYRTRYQTPIGEIMAISITSKGSGETDYVKLYDKLKKLAFADDFR